MSFTVSELCLGIKDGESEDEVSTEGPLSPLCVFVPKSKRIDGGGPGTS